LTEELARALDAPAVVSEFSRLVVDPNREEDSPTLFRELADGIPVALNATVTARDREMRLARFYRPFHAAVDRAAAETRAPVLLSVHTFTPLYEGSPRHMEIGVLFNREEELAERIGKSLRAAGFRIAMNEPWSGRDGLIYSAERHADAHGKAALELEIRQDLACEPVFRSRLVASISAFFRVN
jgi:predicted N-formylglutamate amidohydrolase